MTIKVFHLKKGYTVITDIIEIKRISIRNSEDNRNLYDVIYYDMDGEKVEYTNCEIRHPDHFSTIISNKEGIIIELNQDSIRYNDWEDDDEYYL